MNILDHIEAMATRLNKDSAEREKPFTIAKDNEGLFKKDCYICLSKSSISLGKIVNLAMGYGSDACWDSKKTAEYDTNTIKWHEQPLKRSEFLELANDHHKLVKNKKIIAQETSVEPLDFVDWCKEEDAQINGILLLRGESLLGKRTLSIKNISKKLNGNEYFRILQDAPHKIDSANLIKTIVSICGVFNKREKMEHKDTEIIREVELFIRTHFPSLKTASKKTYQNYLREINAHFK